MPTFQLVDGRPVVPIRLCWDPDEVAAFAILGMDFLASHELHLVGRTFELVRMSSRPR